MIADTSGLLAFFDAGDPHHAAVTKVVDAQTEPMHVSPFVLAELDYLVMTRFGVRDELAVLAELSSGAYDIEQANEQDVAAAVDVIARYDDQRIGLADAHQVVMAERLATRDLLTLDRRHFAVVRPLQGGRFRIYPR